MPRDSKAKRRKPEAGIGLMEPVPIEGHGRSTAGLIVMACASFLLVTGLFLSFFAAGYFAGQGNLQQAPSVGIVSQPASVQGLPEARLRSTINIVSVTSQGTGSLNQADIEIAPGEGRVLFSINPFVEPDTQDSVKTAAVVAQKFTGRSLANKDIIVTVKNTPAQLVGGPSAGAAITVAAIAAIQGRRVRSDAAITGTISLDGSIGQIGGVIEKATAAADQNLALFIVPKGQKNFTAYQQVTEESQRGPFTIIRTHYVPKGIDVQDYLVKQGYSIKVVEARDINATVSLLVE